MLPKKNRLFLRQDRTIFLKGKRLNFNHLRVYTYPSQVGTRFSLVIPKKVVALATKRNRLKRIIYQEVYNCLKKHRFKTANVKLVFYLKKPVLEEEGFKAELRKVLTQLC